MSVLLWLCDKLTGGHARMREETCAKLHARAAKAKGRMALIGIEPCIGCPGIVALNRAAGREPYEIDTSRYKPPRDIPASHENVLRAPSKQNGFKLPNRHHRNDPIRGARRGS